jgi:tetratricopeptide (TPR) repeat protein
MNADHSFPDMKKLAFLSAVSLLLVGFIQFRLNTHNTRAFLKNKMKNIYGCSPAVEGLTAPGVDGKYITVLPGWGNYSYPISTKKDSAQFYFNQGLSMYYSYHWREADASFREATRFDPASAICYWGRALALGPGYNFSLHYKMRKEVPTVLALMNRYAKKASPKEKKLIEVMNLRYAQDTSDSQRKTLNLAYALGMHGLIAAYPDDPDIKILYVDAMMLIHAWDIWNNDGTPKTWSPEMISYCEDVLKSNPNHPAALHYYIHLTEASRHPEVALESADRLKVLMPGVAHMVHMSSHEYERIGSYAMGVEVNDRADEGLINYAALASQIHLSQHASHYFAVQAYCGLSGAMYLKGLSDALRCRRSTEPDSLSLYAQWLYMMPSFTLIRLGRWNEILNTDSVPDASWIYARLINDFARGMAFVQTGRQDSARSRFSEMQQLSSNPQLAEADTLTNTARQGAEEAVEILSANIFFNEKIYDSAIAHMNKAIQVEDRLFYSEPKDWMIPARQWLGAFYLKMGNPAMAEKVYREDLSWNPGNGWSLLGLCQSLEAQNKTEGVKEYREKYLHSFSGAEQIPPGSVYMN